VTYFAKLKMAYTEFSSDDSFYKKGENTLCYFILKTVRFFCRTFYLLCLMLLHVSFAQISHHQVGYRYKVE